MLQKVIDYQFNIVQQKIIADYPSSRPGPNTKRFSHWKLMDTITKIPQYYEYNLLWVGCDQTAHIIAFFYCIVLGSLQISDKKDEAFLKVKFYLYQLSEEFLSIDQQKIFVENICLIQYSKSLTDFLRKSHAFQDVLIKMFLRYHKKHAVVYQFDEQFQPFEELRIYAGIFEFATFEKIDENIGKIAFKNCYFYMIEELDSFFILEEKNMSPIKKMLSESNEELIYQTYRKRSSKKRKQLNSPQNDSLGKRGSSPSKPSVSQDYNTPKFYIKSSKQKIDSNKKRPSHEIKVNAWKQSSEQSSGKKGFIDTAKSEDKTTFPHFLTLENAKTDGNASPQSPKLQSLSNSNAHNLRLKSKGDENKSLQNIWKNEEKSLKENSQKQYFHNPETPVYKYLHHKDKSVVQSLGANQMNKYRRSNPILQENKEPKQKRSVPKFILEKQEKKNKKVSPPQKDIVQLSPLSPTQQIKNNVIRPKISSKVYVNSNTLASPSQYLFAYYVK